MSGNNSININYNPNQNRIRVGQHVFYEFRFDGDNFNIVHQNENHPQNMHINIQPSTPTINSRRQHQPINRPTRTPQQREDVSRRLAEARQQRLHFRDVFRFTSAEQDMLHKKRKHYQRITELYNLTQRYVPDYVRLFEYVALENKGHNIVRFACEISDVDYSCAGNNEMEGLIKIVELSKPDIFKEIQTKNNPMRKIEKISELMGWSFEDDSGLDKETSDLIFDFASMVDMFWFSGDVYNKLIAVNVSFKRDGFITTRLLKLRNQMTFMMTFCLQVMVVVSLIEEHERENKMRKKF